MSSMSFMERLLDGVEVEWKALVATNRANTGVSGKKIPTDKGWDFKLWAGGN